MAWTDDDMKWIRRALALAKEGEREAGKNPIGCVIVHDGEMIGEGCNEVDLRHVEGDNRRNRTKSELRKFPFEIKRQEI